MNQCLLKDYTPKDLQGQVHELEFCPVGLDTLLQTAPEMKGNRQGSHLVPLTKSAIGLASPPDSTLQRSQKKAHLLPWTFVLSPDIAFLGPQYFLLKRTVTSPRTWRMCWVDTIKKTTDPRG